MKQKKNPMQTFPADDDSPLYFLIQWDRVQPVSSFPPHVQPDTLMLPSRAVGNTNTTTGICLTVIKIYGWETCSVRMASSCFSYGVYRRGQPVTPRDIISMKNTPPVDHSVQGFFSNQSQGLVMSLHSKTTWWLVNQSCLCESSLVWGRMGWSMSSSTWEQSVLWVGLLNTGGGKCITHFTLLQSCDSGGDF